MFAIRSTAPCRPVLLGIWSVVVLVSSDAIMFTRHTLEKRIVNVAVTGEFLGTVPSPLFGSIVLHTKTQYQQDRYVESARRAEVPS